MAIPSEWDHENSKLSTVNMLDFAQYTFFEKKHILPFIASPKSKQQICIHVNYVKSMNLKKSPYENEIWPHDERHNCKGYDLGTLLTYQKVGNYCSHHKDDLIWTINMKSHH